jgi:uncharacterized protein
MLYAIIAYDKPNGVDHRAAVRPTHLKHLDSLGDRLVLAGPFVNENGDGVGSFMVIEASSQQEAEAEFGKDPFIQEGVFESWTVRPWKLTINKTKAD